MKSKNLVEVSIHNQLPNMVWTWWAFFTSSEQQLCKLWKSMKTNAEDAVERAPTKIRLQASARLRCLANGWSGLLSLASEHFHLFISFSSLISFASFASSINSFNRHRFHLFYLLHLFHLFYICFHRFSTANVETIYMQLNITIVYLLLRNRFCCWLLSNENDNTICEEKRWEATSYR